jgi:hypothetical protein
MVGVYLPLATDFLSATTTLVDSSQHAADCVTNLYFIFGILYRLRSSQNSQYRRGPSLSGTIASRQSQSIHFIHDCTQTHVPKRLLSPKLLIRTNAIAEILKEPLQHGWRRLLDKITTGIESLKGIQGGCR